MRNVPLKIVAGGVALIAIVGATMAAEPTAKQVMRFAISTPQPHYPENARLARVTGAGLFKLRVRRSTGLVKRVDIIRSTGDRELDDAAVSFVNGSSKQGRYP